MKIHHIINSYDTRLGGAESLVVSLKDHLIIKKIPTHIYGLMNSVKKIDNASNAGLENPYSIKAFFGIKNYIKANVKDEDIIHSHLFPSNFYCSIIKLLNFTNATLITTEHSTSNRRRGNIFGKILDKIIYYPCIQIICISKGVEKKLNDWIIKTSKKTKVIQNGCSLNKNLKNFKNSKNKTIKIISVGSLKNSKNYTRTIKAINRIKKLDFLWQIAGDGRLYKKLNYLVNKFKLNRKIEFLGHVNDVDELLDNADIFLIPSKWEGFGLAAVEAMHSSLPIIASNVDGLKEVVSNEKACSLLINPNDIEDIAIKLEKLIISRKLREKLGINAYHNSLNYSIEKMFEKYISVYKRLSKI
tara:strand:+ start:986 stop:2059 length:1074 start_codon:yes stop_codon:yes gene_type:complete